MLIQLKNGQKELPQGSSAYDLAEALGGSLKKDACAARVNGEAADLRTVLKEGDKVELLTFEDEDGRRAFRHTASHILAQAVKRLYPSAKFAIGPAIKDGFYYDFDFETPLSENDFSKIEAEMEKIVKEDIPLSRYTLPRSEAVVLMEKRGEPYKVELINDLPEEEEISFYEQADFTDLCAGPHLPSTGRVKALKILSLAGAYWRGSEKNPMLTRIYATAFPFGKKKGKPGPSSMMAKRPSSLPSFR